MGIGGIGFWELLVILVVVMLLFGTKKLRNIGGDLGGAIKGFRDALRDGEQTGQPVAQTSPAPATTKQPPLAG